MLSDIQQYVSLFCVGNGVGELWLWLPVRFFVGLRPYAMVPGMRDCLCSETGKIGGGDGLVVLSLDY